MAERPQIEQGLEVAFNPFCALSRSHVTLCCLVNLPIGVFEASVKSWLVLYRIAI